MKNTKRYAAVAAVFVMAACGKHESPAPAGSFAKPTELAAKMQACAESKLAGTQTYIGDDIQVCRVGDDGKVTKKTVTPSFYTSGRQKRIRVAQVVGVTLSYSGATPSADLKNTYENTVNTFLMTKCEPKFRTIFRRSGLLGRFVFQTFLDTDRLAGSDVTTASTVGDREELFGDGQRQVVSSDPKKQVGVDRTRLSPNVRLELVVGVDEGVTIKGAVNPVSSGPLKKANNDDQQNLFCAQLLTRMGENMGLGGLAKDDATCVDPAVAETDTAAKSESKSDASTATPVAVAKPKGNPVGIMKSGSIAAADFINTKLATSEIKTMLTPVCGTLETLPKVDKTSQK